MKKLFTLTICLLIFLLPMVVFGQANSDEDYNKLLQFLKGDGSFEKWFMDAFRKLDVTMAAQSAQTKILGQAIGAVGALCYMGYLGWQMQEGARPWEVTPMIRPTIIAFILIFWTQFTSLVQKPFEMLAEPGIAMFEDIEKDANDLRVKRFKKQTQILNALVEQRAKEEAKTEALDKLEEKTSDSWFDVDMDKLFAPAKEWMMKTQFEFQRLVGDLIEAVSLSILRICTYLIFFIQKIWSYILIVLGPIAVGMSLVPGFENSFNNWLAKFININLYTFVTYTIINIGQQIIMSGYTMELERYDLLISDGGVVDYNTLFMFVSSNGMIFSQLFTAVAYIITGIGILMVPSIADTIVSAGGAGMMSKGKAAGGAVMSAAKAAGSGGATIAASAAKSAAAGTPSGMVAGAMKNGK